METNRIKKVLKYGALGIVGVTAFGYLMMMLWNWLMPAVFGFRTVGFWQALGLFLLFSILFGGCRNQGSGKRPEASSSHDAKRIEPSVL